VTTDASHEPVEATAAAEIAVGPVEAPGVSTAEPPLVTLTTLQPVGVTSVWPTEAHHFTPWLLQNAELLGGVLGLDLALEAREYRVGKYALDLIGKDLTTGEPVIVENQYGPTDHNHLGQILTYAGGTKPSTIVWIAEEFREEHRAALEWHNAHTDTGIRFFGVRLAAVTLKGAPHGLIAPSLELVVTPNEFEKRGVAAVSASTGVSTPTAELYQKFWSTFAPMAKGHGWTNASPPTDNWWSMPAGVTGASWTVSYAQFGCRSELFFGHPDAAVNLARWTVLNNQQAAMRSAFGSGDLIFDELPNNKGCRIETRLLGPKIADQDRWDEVRAWMLDTQERLRAAVASVGGVPTVQPAQPTSAPAAAHSGDSP
jgi:hypothetical protein